MNIVSLLDSDTFIPQLEASSKKEVLEQLIETLRTRVDEDDLKRISDAVFEREAIMSTGVGKGLAIPHGKAQGLQDNYAAFAILKSPVEYEAIDDMPVRMVFLLVGPESQNSTHIKMLSRISRLMNNAEFREKLMKCESSEDIISAFESEEKQYFGVNQKG